MSIQRRSNRPLTQYACVYLDQFLKGKLDSCTETNENTSIECDNTRQHQSFSAYLYGEEILNVALANDEPVSVRVSVGKSFTMEGYPKKTTIERLNGLLDELGCHGIIPSGVRIFKDRIEQLFYLGKGDNKVAVGRDLATCISLTPDEEVFSIEQTDLCLTRKCHA